MHVAQPQCDISLPLLECLKGKGFILPRIGKNVGQLAGMRSGTTTLKNHLVVSYAPAYLFIQEQWKNTSIKTYK